MKRKRDDHSTEQLLNSSMKSMSQLSISQSRVSKKSKHTTIETATSNNEINNEMNSQNYTFYKPSKYLKMPRRLLLHSLYFQLKYPLKKKNEQRFILSRLKIIDEQFCLDQIRYLYQTYLDLGLHIKFGL